MKHYEEFYQKLELYICVYIHKLLILRVIGGKMTDKYLTNIKNELI